MPLSDDLVHSLLGMPSQHVHNLVVAKIEECVTTLNNRLASNGVSIRVPTIKYDLVGITAGQATSRNVIRLNLAALNGEYRDYMINQTVPHEMAHIAEFQLFGEAAHGRRWQQLCRILGIEPERTHSLPLKKARRTTKFKYGCNCMGRAHWVGKNRHNKMQLNPRYLHCRVCGAHLVYKYESSER